MFEFVRDSDFDFLGWWRVCIGVSGTLMLASVVALLTLGLNLGVEFTGGTELQIKYGSEPQIGEIRAALERSGLGGATVTRIGEAAEHEVYIRLGATAARAEGTEDADLASRVVAALHGEQVAPNDLNLIDRAALERLLAGAPGASGETARTLAGAILDRRRAVAIFGGPGDLAEVPGMTAELGQYLEGVARFGPMALRSQSFIGPTVGGELARKAAWAIFGSLVGMLVYIWIRFRFEWGLGAVVALFHDVVITLGLVSVFHKEVSLPVVAAFLTLVGYSVNDTVVIFDRIRENMQKKGAADGFEALVNRSINQTLGRTLITSGLTWVSCAALYLFGGPALNPFAFVLTFGIITGTYSSVYVASPVLLLWQRHVSQRRRKPAGEASPPVRARKVRAGTPS